MSAFGEMGGREPQVAYARRRKSGLEVPLVGRIYRERILTFSPPLRHDLLMGLCILFGAVTALTGMTGGFSLPLNPFVSLAIMLAGLWAAMSHERMIINLRQKTYTRYEGLGLGKRVIRGNLSELDALVLTAEQYAHGTGFSASAVYRLVLYWKGMRHPPLVAEREQKAVPFGAPLNASAQRILARGMRYAQAMGIPYYDNSHLYAKSPVPIV